MEEKFSKQIAFENWTGAWTETDWALQTELAEITKSPNRQGVKKATSQT